MSMKTRQLNDKVAIITGSGTGLGKATALAFADEGAKVVLCGRRADKIEQTRAEIVGNGGQAVAVQTDMTSEKQIKRLVEVALQHYGRVDIAVNNAAVCEVHALAEMPLQAWDRQLTTNVTGAFLLMREVLPFMRRQKSGVIINITSALAYNGAGGYAAYSASKAALEALTRTAADEESGYRIQVSLFDPGTIKTEMHGTGSDPSHVAPDIVRMAALQDSSLSGKLVRAGQLKPL